jgi:transposase
VHSSQLFRWRKKLCQRTELVPVKVAATAGVSEKTVQLPLVAPSRNGMIEIELAGGCLVRVDGDVDAEALRRVLDVLGSR